MAIWGKCRKVDILQLISEMGIEIASTATIVDLKDAIKKSEHYEQDFVEQFLATTLEERLAREKEEMARIKLQEEHRLFLEKQEMENKFILEKLKLEKNTTTEAVKSRPREEIHHLMQKFDPKSADISLYLVLFERQARRIELPEKQWVSHLTGLLPIEMAQLIARESEETYEDYEAIKKVLLNRYKLSPEKFRQLFFSHNKGSEGTWKDFLFELKNYFFEWIKGLKVGTFEELCNLMLTEQVKRKASFDIKEHFIDEWAQMKNPENVVEKLDEYENVRMLMKKKTFPPKDKPFNSWRSKNHSEPKAPLKEPKVEKSENERSKSNEAFEKRKKLRCFRCDSTEHLRPNCPLLKKTSESSGINRLILRGDEEFMSPYTYMGEVNGFAMPILRDTGTNIDVVCRNRITPEMLTGENILVQQPLDEFPVSLPLAEVELKGEFGHVITKAAVVSCQVDEGRYLLGNQTAALLEKMSADGAEEQQNKKIAEKSKLIHADVHDSMIQEKEVIVNQLSQEVEQYKKEITLLSKDLDFQKEKYKEINEEKNKLIEALSTSEKKMQKVIESADIKVQEAQAKVDSCSKDMQNILSEQIKGVERSLHETYSKELKTMKEEVETIKKESDERILKAENEANLRFEEFQESFFEKLNKINLESEEKVKKAVHEKEFVQNELKNFSNSVKEFLCRIFPNIEVPLTIDNKLCMKEYEKEAVLHLEKLKNNVKKGSNDLRNVIKKLEESAEEKRNLEAQIQNYESFLTETESILKTLQKNVKNEGRKWRKELQNKDKCLKEGFDGNEKLKSQNKTMEAHLEQLQGIKELERVKFKKKRILSKQRKKSRKKKRGTLSKERPKSIRLYQESMEEKIRDERVEEAKSVEMDQFKSLSPYERMNEEKGVEKITLLNYMEIDQIKSEISDAMSDMKKMNTVSRLYMKVQSPASAEPRSGRLANIEVDFSENALEKLAVKYSFQTSPIEYTENFSPKLTFKDALKSAIPYEECNSDLIVQDTKPGQKFILYNRNVFNNMTLKEFNVCKVIPARITSEAWCPSKEDLVVSAADKYGNLSFWKIQDSETNPYLFRVRASNIPCTQFCSYNTVQLFTVSYDNIMQCDHLVKHSSNEIYVGDVHHCSWTDKCEHASVSLKNSLCNFPVVYAPNYKKKF